VKRVLRVLGGAALIVAVSAATSGCDTSPFAVRVNSTVIKQAALYTELHAWSGNRAYVAAFDAAYSTSNGGTGVTVAGDNPRTYSTAWVANILTGMVTAALVDQEVAATRHTPSPALVAAARSVSEIDHSGYWSQFSLAFRQVLSLRLADQAAITPTSTPVSTLLSLFSEYRSYFFTQVCVVQASAFSLAGADALVAAGVVTGTPLCYDQAQFEQQPTAFQNDVRGLAVGKVAPPIKTTYGYQVVRVVSRDVQTFSPDVQRALSVAYVAAEGSPDPVLSALFAKARVQVNPAYGTWQGTQVMPPTQPTV
jgi:hypothetical protein